jgi:hypothetical protein
MRPQNITFGVLVYCADYRCSHSVALSADGWPDQMRLSDIEPRFVCAGRLGAEVRPDFNWNGPAVPAIMGYRNTDWRPSCFRPIRCADEPY